MTRLMTLLMLVVMGAVVVRTQDDKPNPYMTNDSINGLWWRTLTHDAKSIYVFGVKDGYMRARLDLTLTTRFSFACQNDVKAVYSRWYEAKISAEDFTPEDVP